MENTKSIVETLLAVLTAVASSGFLAYALGGFRAYLEAKRRHTVLLKLENIKEGKKVMQEMRNESNVTRVMLFNGHDSGSTPDIGRPFYVTLIDFLVDPKYSSALEDYDSFKVDAAYIEMLIHLIKEGVYDVRTSGMHDGVLRTIYEANGVKHARLYYLGTLKDRIIYTSIASHVREFTPAEVVRLDILADKLRTVYRNRY